MELYPSDRGGTLRCEQKLISFSSSLVVVSRKKKTFAIFSYWKKNECVLDDLVDCVCLFVRLFDTGAIPVSFRARDNSSFVFCSCVRPCVSKSTNKEN